MSRRDLLHRPTALWQIRPWVDNYGPNMRVCTAEEVLELMPHFTSEECFISMGGIPDAEPEPLASSSVTAAAGRLAAAHDIDLDEVDIPGTGADGSVLKTDVQAYLDSLDEESVLDQI